MSQPGQPQIGEASHGLLRTPGEENTYSGPEPGSIDEKRKKRVRGGLICCHLVLWWTIGGGFFWILIWCLFGCLLYPCGNAGRRCFTIARVCITPLRFHLIPARCCKDCKKCGQGWCGAFIWAIAIGWHIMLFHFLMGIIFIPWNLCDVPISRTHFKLGRIALRPFSATIIRKEDHEMFYVVGASESPKITPTHSNQNNSQSFQV